MIRIVTKVISTPHQFGDKWHLIVESRNYGKAPNHILEFDSKEAADQVGIGYEYSTDDIYREPRKAKLNTLSVRQPFALLEVLGVYDERSRGGKKIGYFRRAVKNLPLATIMTSNTFSIDEEPAQLNDTELALCSTFPMDYEYLDNDVQYIVGMSAPPVMIAQIADRVYEYWLSKINVPAQEKALAI